MKNLYKLVLGLVISVGLVFSVATSANASEIAVSVPSVPQNNLVCAEAWRNGKDWHLGCSQWVEGMKVYIRDDMPAGNYTVRFNYQDSSGVWRKVSEVMVTKSATVAVTTVNKTTLNHAYIPYQINQAAGDPSNSIHARVDNFTDRSVKVTLCAEAFGMGGKWHLGCLPQKVELDRMWGDNWAIDMNVYATGEMPRGNYSVHYTYQDEGGKWHDVKDMTGKPVRTTLRV